MKICVLSDSHGEIENLRRVADSIRGKVDLVIHLGDTYSDADELRGFNLIRVPGVYDDEYRNPMIKNRIVKNFGKLKVLITHTKESHVNDQPYDLKPEDLIEKKKVDAVFYGHTHIYNIEIKDGILFLNPGHLKKEDKKGLPPTYAIIEIGSRIKAAILGLNGEKKIEKEFEF